MGLEDQVGEALEGRVRYHMEGLDFRVALALILGGLECWVALALVGGLGLVACSDPGKLSPI